VKRKSTKQRRTLSRLELLEHFDETDGTDEVGVLGSGLNDDLKVLANVDLQHLVEAFESLLDRELAEVVDEPLCVSGRVSLAEKEETGRRKRTSAARRLTWTTTRLMSAMSL
jgi:hypothetical protein